MKSCHVFVPSTVTFVFKLIIKLGMENGSYVGLGTYGAGNPLGTYGVFRHA